MENATELVDSAFCRALYGSNPRLISVLKFYKHVALMMDKVKLWYMKKTKKSHEMAEGHFINPSEFFSQTLKMAVFCPFLGTKRRSSCLPLPGCMRPTRMLSLLIRHFLGLWQQKSQFLHLSRFLSFFGGKCDRTCR